jgi:hypothetical protein
LEEKFTEANETRPDLIMSQWETAPVGMVDGVSGTGGADKFKSYPKYYHNRSEMKFLCMKYFHTPVIRDRCQ